jgi:hypothetical protein
MKRQASRVMWWHRLPHKRPSGQHRRNGEARVELGPEAQSKIYEKSSIDLAMRDAFRKMRHFLMTTKGLSEDEAISLMSVAVDFGVTQVVDGNWGVHAIIKEEPLRRRLAGYGQAPADLGRCAAATLDCRPWHGYIGGRQGGPWIEVTSGCSAKPAGAVPSRSRARAKSAAGYPASSSSFSAGSC